MSRIPALWLHCPTDVARSGINARRAFQTVFLAMVSVLERSLSPNGSSRRAAAQGIAALSIGGMIVARTMVDRTLADELRTACRRLRSSLAAGTIEAGRRQSTPGKPNHAGRLRSVEQTRSAKRERRLTRRCCGEEVFLVRFRDCESPVFMRGKGGACQACTSCYSPACEEPSKSAYGSVKP
jgi:hypothetical protein